MKLELARRALVPSSIWDVLLKDATNSFLETEGHASNHTFRARVEAFKQLLDFLGEETLLCDVTSRDLTDFVDYLGRSGKSRATIAQRMHLIKKMFRTIQENIPGYLSPARTVKVAKVTYSEPRKIATEELRTFLAHVRGSDCAKYEDLRLRGVVEVLYAIGLRIGEVLSLKLGQVSPTADAFLDVRVKSGKIVIKEIPNALRPILLELVERHSSYLRKYCNSFGMPYPTNVEEYPLFLSSTAAQRNRAETWELDQKSLRRQLARALKAANVSHHTPHQYRHTLAYDLVDSGTPLSLVSQLLNHSNVNTTMRYVTADREAKRDALNRRLEDVA